MQSKGWRDRARFLVGSKAQFERWRGRQGEGRENAASVYIVWAVYFPLASSFVRKDSRLIPSMDGQRFIGALGWQDRAMSILVTANINRTGWNVVRQWPTAQPKDDG